MKRFCRPALVCATIGAVFGLTLSPAASAGPSGAADASEACSRWHVVDLPDLPAISGLAGVAALSSDDVWAVGSTGGFSDEAPLALHWDGTTWDVVNTPNPRPLSTDGNVLNAVAAINPSDVWAVGTHFKNGHTFVSPLIEHWDGQRWRVVPKPDGRLSGAFFRGVTAVASDDVWAVGQRIGRGTAPRDPMVAHWDGSAWKLVRVPKPRDDQSELLVDVSATSARDVWAVGQKHVGYAAGSSIASKNDGLSASSTTTLAMHFDGTNWKIVPSPGRDTSGSLSGIVSLAANDVWAVGWGGLPTTSLAEHWDGTAWSIKHTADRPQFDLLYDVTARGPSDLWAVGTNQTPDSESLTLVEHFDGSSWALADSPSPGTADRLLGVTTAGGSTWAVGATADAAGGGDQALIEHRCS